VQKHIAEFDHQRFLAVDEREREEIFQDYLDDLLKLERDAKVQKSKENIKQIKSLLYDHTPQNIEARVKKIE